MKEIQLTKGKVAIVDDDVYDYLKQWKWYCQEGRNLYAVRRISVDGKQAIYSMHQAVYEYYNGPLPEGYVIDHKNRNSLDERIENLRACTCSENSRNRPSVKNTSSECKGVSYYQPLDEWRSRIRSGNNYIHLGGFSSEKLAGIAYDLAAIKYFKEFAYLNFPEESMALYDSIHRGLAGEISFPFNYTAKDILRIKRIFYKKYTFKGGSKFLGVGWDKQVSKWQIKKRINGKSKHLGFYKTQLEASLAYDEFIYKTFGLDSKHKMNFPERYRNKRTEQNV